MLRAACLLALLLFATAPAAAASDPLAQDRKALAECLERTAGEGDLKRMSACIGLIGDKCADAPGATTISIVECHSREQSIWDEWLNAWYEEAQGRLKDNAGASAALKEAQRAWIAYRDAKCGFWSKLYEGGTFASVAAGDCMRVTTGMRAIEMRAIADELDH